MTYIIFTHFKETAIFFNNDIKTEDEYKEIILDIHNYYIG